MSDDGPIWLTQTAIASPGAVTCFTSPKEEAAFWKNTVVTYINETTSGKFDDQDLKELYSQVDLSEQKLKIFAEGCQNGPAGPYLKYVGTTSTVRDLASLGDAIVGKDEPINYWGVSYGTVIGFNFVNSEIPTLFSPCRWLNRFSSVPRGKFSTTER